MTRVMLRSRTVGLASALIAVVFCASAPSAQINMPDPSQIHGKALPAGDLPPGTITVRVVRQAIGNNITGQDVRVTVGSASNTATTDEQGRALFDGLPIGAEGRAEAVVDGEPLVSEPFQVPESGGLRVILVAGLGEATARRQKEAADAAAAPPQKGIVVLGGDSRIIMEFQGDALQVFYILSIVNNARTRVDIGGPLILQLPRGAGGASIMEGSSPTASVSGDVVTVTGPFQAGTTSVQVGFSLRYDDAQYAFQQQLPVALERVTMAIEKVRDVDMASPQFADKREVQSENGTRFVLANGPALPANSTLSVTLSNLPLHSTTPRRVALALAGAIVALGAWLAFTARGGDARTRQQLVAKRDTLLGDLTALEARRRAGRIDEAGYSARRQSLLAELEQVFGELDDAGVQRPGGDEGVAA